MNYAIKYEDDNGCDLMTIGPFDERTDAVEWMFWFAKKRCSNCTVRTVETYPYESIQIAHDQGSIATMHVIVNHTPAQFLAEWNT